MARTNDAAAQSGSLHTILRAYEMLGLTSLIGEPGEYTAFVEGGTNDLVLHIIPGRFSSDEFIDMIECLSIPPVSDRPVESEWQELLVAA